MIRCKIRKCMNENRYNDYSSWLAIYIAIHLIKYFSNDFGHFSDFPYICINQWKMLNKHSIYSGRFFLSLSLSLFSSFNQFVRIKTIEFIGPIHKNSLYHRNEVMWKLCEWKVETWKSIRYTRLKYMWRYVWFYFWKPKRKKKIVYLWLEQNHSRFSYYLDIFATKNTYTHWR